MAKVVVEEKAVECEKDIPISPTNLEGGEWYRYLGASRSRLETGDVFYYSHTFGKAFFPGRANTWDVWAEDCFIVGQPCRKLRPGESFTITVTGE